VEQFPKGFRFGVADADLQVIGEDATRSQEGSEETMWSVFARTSGRCAGDATPAIGVERFSRWADDATLMRDLSVKHYRTSISMSRLLKRSGDVNGAAVDWYRRYFARLREDGVGIYATLYHWELPQFLAERGGWTNRETVDWFLRHVRAVAQELGDLVDEYFLINEPWCIAMLGHHQGIHAPGERSFRAALAAAHHVLLAIGLGFEAVQEIAPGAKVGTVFNAETYYAASERDEDRRAQRHADGWFNRWFMDPLFVGRYPGDMWELYRDHRPEVNDADLKAMCVGAKLHSFGLNYYSAKFVRHAARSPLPFEEATPAGQLTNDLGWPISIPPVYPDALRDMILQLWNSYRSHGLKRIYITENGMAQQSRLGADGRPEEDARRIHYLQQHLRQVRQAILAGAPVEAYFAWTLMDNYEWAEGYRPESCFGLVHVDRGTMRRLPKASAHWYQKVMATGQV